MTTYYVLGIAAYLAFGFGYGIAREWAWQEFDSPRGLVRRCFTFFFFPVIAADSIRDCCGYPSIIDSTGGGFAYWNLLALVWPVVLAWQLFMNVVILIIGIGWLFMEILSSPGKLCKRCENAIKDACGISN